MTKTHLLEEVWSMRFEEIYGRWNKAGGDDSSWRHDTKNVTLATTLSFRPPSRNLTAAVRLYGRRYRIKSGMTPLSPPFQGGDFYVAGASRDRFK